MAVVQKKEKTGMSSFSVLAVLLIAALAAALGYVVYTNMGNSALAENNLKKLYRFQTGADAEIMSVKEQNGLYRFTVRSGNSVQDIYMTRDGMLMATGLFDVDIYVTSLESQRDFAQCLVNKSVVIAGVSTDNYTIMQLQVIGAYSNALFFDCNSNIQACVNANITTVPTTIYNGSRYEGVRDVSFFEQLTGCSLNT
jgi:hypothetical protein